MSRFTASPGQTVFARWKNSYYYPAMVDAVTDDGVKVTYLEDGLSALVSHEYIVELQEAFDTMQFQGNWQHGGFFYKGKLASHLPLVMHYNDGDVEQIELSQLRGTRPEPVEESVPIQSEKEAVKELKTLLKNGLISKEEFKRRRNLLR